MYWSNAFALPSVIAPEHALENALVAFNINIPLFLHPRTTR
ncbi:hypothetical protein pETSU_004 [Edwardsiella phage pEt-SU]|uniref:Uncharacterized protein n=1 Tax=Edwardsiella phage pEt-SU TaxID=2562142 RepID=A0A4D6DW85_9CAUD|nr:hypothetical protein HOV39_gp004 [Edwardsiella phage pEt-SU]QBZ70585.1 hypothetical protein pETSU_004 [Edwardsiella phage pEt-SU]